jgi:hypothetical protein
MLILYSNGWKYDLADKLGKVTYDQSADGYKQELFLKGAMVSTITGSGWSD